MTEQERREWLAGLKVGDIIATTGEFSNRERWQHRIDKIDKLVAGFGFCALLCLIVVDERRRRASEKRWRQHEIDVSLGRKRPFLWRHITLRMNHWLKERKEHTHAD